MRDRLVRASGRGRRAWKYENHDTGLSSPPIGVYNADAEVERNPHGILQTPLLAEHGSQATNEGVRRGSPVKTQGSVERGL